MPHINNSGSNEQGEKKLYALGYVRHRRRPLVGSLRRDVAPGASQARQPASRAALRRRRVLFNRRHRPGRHALFARTVERPGLELLRRDDGDGRRRPRRRRRGLHHPGFQKRRPADLRNAAGVRRRAGYQRVGHYGESPAEDHAESAALRRFSAGRAGREHGSLFQTAVIIRLFGGISAVSGSGRDSVNASADSATLATARGTDKASADSTTLTIARGTDKYGSNNRRG